LLLFHLIWREESSGPNLFQYPLTPAIDSLRILLPKLFSPSPAFIRLFLDFGGCRIIFLQSFLRPPFSLKCSQRFSPVSFLNCRRCPGVISFPSSLFSWKPPGIVFFFHPSLFLSGLPMTRGRPSRPSDSCFLAPPPGFPSFCDQRSAERDFRST